MEGFGLGEPYNYVNNIRNPEEMGISSSGNKIAHNISSMFHYVQLLSDGGKAGSKDPGRLMGNKQFLPTLSKCIPINNTGDVKTIDGKDVIKCGGTDNNETVDMSLYVNDVPSGKFTPKMHGLVPGIVEDSISIVPNFDSGALMGELPECACVSFPIKINDGKGNGKEKEHTTNLSAYPDTKHYKRYKAKYTKNNQPCWFISKTDYERLKWSEKITTNKYDEIFANKNKECFTNMSSSENTIVNTTNIYVSACLLLLMYITFKAIHR